MFLELIKTKIIYVSKSILFCLMYYRNSVDACANRFRSIVQKMVEDGNKVVVACTSDEEGVFEEEGCTIVSFKCDFNEHGNAKNRLKRDLYFKNRLKKTFLKTPKWHFDVIIGSSPDLIPNLVCVRLQKKFKARFIFDVRDIWPDVAVEMGSFSNHSLYAAAFNKISFYLYDHADAIDVVSPRKMTKIQTLKKGKYAAKVFLIENGFDTAIINVPEDDRAVKDNALDKTKNIVFLGNVGLAQHLDFMLSLAEEFKTQSDYRFFIVGDGADLSRLKQMAADRKISNLYFPGRVSQTVAKTFLLHTFISVIPLRNSEMKDSIPSKLYESLGLGIPVFLLAEGDAKDLLLSCGGGIAIPPESNQQVILREFDNFIQKYSEIKQKSLKSSEFIIKTYTREIAAKKMEELL